jgi:hypothetical protein
MIHSCCHISKYIQMDCHIQPSLFPRLLDIRKLILYLLLGNIYVVKTKMII